MRQTDKMRELFRRYRGNKTRVIREYALAEQQNVVIRKSNRYGLTAIDYATRLFADGVRKGWIHD